MEAAVFYTSISPNSKITYKTTVHQEPTTTGDCDIIAFELDGQPFMAINTGPLFKFNPSISLIVHFDPVEDKYAREKLDVLWEKLSHGGAALMPLDKYPFSDRYGWIKDKFGLYGESGRPSWAK